MPVSEFFHGAFNALMTWVWSTVFCLVLLALLAGDAMLGYLWHTRPEDYKKTLPYYEHFQKKRPDGILSQYRLKISGRTFHFPVPRQGTWHIFFPRNRKGRTARFTFRPKGRFDAVTVVLREDGTWKPPRSYRGPRTLLLQCPPWGRDKTSNTWHWHLDLKQSRPLSLQIHCWNGREWSLRFPVPLTPALSQREREDKPAHAIALGTGQGNRMTTVFPPVLAT